MTALNSAAKRCFSVRGGVFFITAIVWTAGLHAQAQAPAAERQATEMLPQTVVAFAAASDLGELLKTVLNHPLRARVESLPAFEALVRSGGLAQLQQGIAGFEATMGQPWQQALTTLTDGGVSVALDSSEGGVAILVKSSDAEQLKRFRGFLLAIAQMRQGKFSPVEQGEYRGITAYALTSELKLALVDHWLLITNKSELGKSIIDRYLDPTDDSLQTSERFNRALAEMDSQNDASAVSAYVDVDAMRGAGIAKALYNEKVDNPVAELALGGILANLRHTSYVTAKLNVNDDGVRLVLNTPHQRDWESPREYFFGEPGHVAAPPLLQVEDRLFAISAHRNLSQMWLRSGDLLTDRANDGLTKADTQLSTFFSGRDFGEDILGSLGSDVQLVAKAQDFTNVLPQPAIKLPAFALQFRMNHPEETRPELRRVFQSLVGFLNVVGAMNGQPQLDLGMESLGDAQLVTASYVPDRDKRESTAAPIHFNFTPTVAFAGDRIIFSSGIKLAKELVGQAQQNSTEPSSHNTELVVEADTLQKVLRANKSHLVAKNMLEKGHDKQAAEGEIGFLLEIVGFFRDAKFDLDVTDSRLQFTAKLSLNTDHLE